MLSLCFKPTAKPTAKSIATFGAAVALSLSAVLPVVPAQAASRHVARYQTQGPQPYQAQSGIDPDYTTCIKLCPSDYLPCDPIYFKLADQRCQRY